MNESSSPAPAPVSPLWTRDFTIITLGSVISMLGNSMSGFALSLLVLDYTGSNLLYESPSGLRAQTKARSMREGGRKSTVL